MEGAWYGAQLPRARCQSLRLAASAGDSRPKHAGEGGEGRWEWTQLCYPAAAIAQHTHPFPFTPCVTPAGCMALASAHMRNPRSVSGALAPLTKPSSHNQPTTRHLSILQHWCRHRRGCPHPHSLRALPLLLSAPSRAERAGGAGGFGSYEQQLRHQPHRHPRKPCSSHRLCSTRRLYCNS